jgi:type IX secretion system PorP/SprF family membrane protein
MLKQTLYFLLITVSVFTAMAQETTIPQFSLETQNWTKFNQNFVNPTFSLVRENSTYLSLLNRNESIEFDDNFNTYLFNYSGKTSETTGVGMGLFQQSKGVFRYFGATANYAYGFNFSENTSLTLGTNLSFYKKDLRNSDFSTSDGPMDPLLFNQEEKSVLSFQPGINLTVGNFDLGVYAENLIEYDLKNSESIGSFADKTFSGHLMYTANLNQSGSVGMFENASMRVLARARKAGEQDVTLSGNLILDLPKIGWVQGGYDDFYGGSAGIGLNLTKNISVGYTIEKAFSGDRSNFGATHELSLGYRFDPIIDKGLIAEEEPIEEEEPVLATSAREMQELKDNMAINMQLLEDFLIRQDSINEANDNRFNRLMTTLASMQTRNGRDGKDGRDGVNTTVIVSKPKVPETKTSTTTVQKPRVTYAAPPKPKKRKGAVTINGVDEGYYLIANVYKANDDTYFKKFYNELKAKGLNPGTFVNPSNGLRYVYLRKHDNRSAAINSYKSKLDNQYGNELWVMDVVNDTDVRIAQKSGPEYKFKDAISTTSPKKDVSSSNITQPKPKKEAVVAVAEKKAPAKNSTAETSTRKKITKPRIMNAQGVDGGFYIVANVFSKKYYADRFVKKLKEEGIEAAYFVNPDNNYRYVYLKKLDSWNTALTSYYSNIDDTYFDNIWIMRVNQDNI